MAESTATQTLSDFLLARIAADESLARSAIDGGSDYFLSSHKPDAETAGEVWARLQVERWTPDRVLAECQAKRRIVADHDRDGDHCVMCHWEDEHACPTIRHLAAVYADHPDYRQEWRP